MAPDMNNFPYYKRYPDNLFDATQGWPNELKANYALLIDLIMKHDAKLRDDDSYIAAMLGFGSSRPWKRIKKQLVELGKIDVVDGMIVNRKANEVQMDRERLSFDQANRRKNPNKNKSIQSPGKNPASTNKDIDIEVPYGTSYSEDKSSDAFASFPDPVEHDPKAYVWGVGVEYMTSHGVKEKTARVGIGRLVKIVGITEAEKIVSSMQASGTQDPLTYIGGAVQKNAKSHGGNPEKFAAKFSIAIENGEIVKRDTETGSVISRERVA